MNYASLGDNMRQFQQTRQNFSLKTTLNTLVNELSSGEKSDKVKATNGDTAKFSAIDNRLKVLSSLAYLSSETELTLSSTQTALSNFDVQRGALAGQLLTITSDTPDFQIEQAAAAGRSRLDGLISTLNTKLGEDSLFAGKAVDQAALTSADTMLTDILAQIGGATDTATIAATVDTWFDDPAGGFATIGFTGDTGDQPQRRLDMDTQITIDARADDPGIKAVLKGAVLAALAQEVPGLSKLVQTDLLSEAGLQLQSAASDVAAIQGRVGYAEGEVERFAVSQSAEQSALTMARNLITQADPFETATELQAVQLQLETHYAMTARLSGLSLMEYLR
jgi:flagellar hook-associated protein 3 FlgL